MAKISRDHISQYYDNGIDIDSKTIDFSGDIDEELAVQTIKSLRILDRIRPEQPITITINSSGGEVDQGLAIYDEIRRCKSQVHTEVVGIAYSMAAWILQAGDVRKATRHSSIMIHQGDEGDLGDRKKDIKRWIQYSDESDLYCEDILLDKIRAKHPEYTRKKLKILLDTDTIFWPEQAIALGLLDETI